MMDLERVLPPGVQVTSIDPVIAKDGEVSIRLRVTGERDRAIQLVRNLEHSSRFRAARLSGETALTADKAKAIGAQTTGPQTTGGAPGLQQVGDQVVSGVEFEIFSGYNPLPAASAADAKEAGEGKKKAAKPDPDDAGMNAQASAAGPRGTAVRKPQARRVPAAPVTPLAPGPSSLASGGGR